MRPIDEIVLHCAATPEGEHFTVADIDRWHRARGFSGIGYHYVVYLDGTVHEGRPVARQGAHVKGRNARTIGVCYIGGVTASGEPKDTRTAAQKAALDRLLRRLLAEHPGIATISGHNQHAAKACPCYPAAREHAHLLGGKADGADGADAPLRRGARGPAVCALQRGLVRVGHAIAVDGVFGLATLEAVKAWQRHLGVREDGVPGDWFMRRLEEAGAGAPANSDPKPADPKLSDPKPAAPKPGGSTGPAASSGPGTRGTLVLSGHSKLIGALLGGVLGVAASFGLPVDWATPELRGALVVLTASAFVYAFPANA